MKRLTLLLLSLLASCAGTSVPKGDPPPTLSVTKAIVIKPQEANWNSMDDVRKALAGAPVRITGNTVDLNDCQIVGTKLKRYDNIQDERNQGIRVSIDGFTLKNGSLKNLPGGLVFRGDGLTFNNLVFVGVGEDALSNIMDASPNATVNNCRGYGATDKTFQMNDIRGLTFTENHATGGITGVRLQKKATKYPSPRPKLVRDNQFVKVDTAWNVSGGAKVKSSGNRYSGVRTIAVTNDGASFTEN